MDSDKRENNLNCNENEPLTNDHNNDAINIDDNINNEVIIHGDAFDVRESSDETKTIETHEERMRRIKETNEIERRRRLEEIIEAQKRAEEKRHKEMLERKKKIDNLNKREDERKKLAEQKRKLLEEKEKEKTENILKRNREREERIAQQKMTQSTQSFRAFQNSRMATSLHNSNGVADSNHKLNNSNTNNYNYHNSSRSSWLLSSCDNINNNNNNSYTKHTSRASINRKSAHVSKNRTRSHDPMFKNSNGGKITPHSCRRNIIPDGFIEVDSGVVIPANTRHAGCFVPYKGPSYRVRGVLAWRPPPPLPNYSSSLSSSNQSSPRMNSDDVTKNRKNSAAWWHEIKSKKTDNKVRPRTSQSTPRSITSINKNRKVSMSSGDGDGDGDTDNIRNPYQRTRRSTKPPIVRRTVGPHLTKTTPAMSTSVMVTKEEKKGKDRKNRDIEDKRSFFDRLSKPRRGGSQPPKPKEKNQENDKKETNVVPKAKQSPLPPRTSKFSNTGISAKPPNNSTTTPKIIRKSLGITPPVPAEKSSKSILHVAVLAAQKSQQRERYSTTPRDSGLSSTPNSELVEHSEQEQSVQPFHERNSLNTSKTHHNGKLDASQNTKTNGGPELAKSKKEVTKSNVKEIDTSNGQEETGLTEKEVYKLKLQESKRMVREQREKEIEEKRRKDEENRLKILEERRLQEEEARLNLQKQRELEEQEEANRLAELERQRLIEEEEARKKEEQERVEKELLLEKYRKEEEEKKERKRKLDLIMSRVKPNASQPTLAPSVMTNSNVSIKENEDARMEINTYGGGGGDENTTRAIGDNAEMSMAPNGEECDTNKTLCMDDSHVREVWRDEDQVCNEKKDSAPTSEIQDDLIGDTTTALDAMVMVEDEDTTNKSSEKYPNAQSTLKPNKPIPSTTPQFKSKLLQNLLVGGRLSSTNSTKKNEQQQQNMGLNNSITDANGLSNSHKRHSMVVTSNGFHNKSIDDTDAKTDYNDQTSYNTSFDLISHSRSLNGDISRLSTDTLDNNNVDIIEQERFTSNTNDDTSYITDSKGTAHNAFYLEEINNNEELPTLEVPVIIDSSENNKPPKYQQNQITDSTDSSDLVDTSNNSNNTDYNMNMEPHLNNINELSS